MVRPCTSNFQIILGRILGPDDPRRLRKTGRNPYTGTRNPCPGRDNFITGYFDSFQCLATDIPCCRTKIHRVFPQPGMDGHGCAFDLAPANRTTGPPTVHGIPFDRSPDTALLMDLGSACLFIHHYQEFLCKEWSEPLFYFVRTQGNHVIAEIFVNRNIGNNLFIEIDKRRRFFT
jgi:hypothetical protein